MSSIIQSIQKRTSIAQSLPLSNSPADASDHPAAVPGLRRRLSSLSLNLQPVTYSPAWAFRRSKSLSSMGEAAGTSIKSWWDWGWTWILSRKPIFARDLEINEEETRTIGSGSRGSLRHVLYKVRSEIRRLVSSDHNAGLPQTFRDRGTI